MVDARRDLRAQCAQCFGLCCVALPFSASADFAVDKPAGQPCQNLLADFSCGIHDRLRENGFAGCTVFDCFGAGQHLSQHTFGGLSWRHAPETRASMFAALPIMRGLHELLWYLTDALDRTDTTPLHPDLRTRHDEVVHLTDLDADQLTAVDLNAERARTGDLLEQASRLVRGDPPGPNHRGADLVGRRLRGKDLRAAHLRGALLIGADARRADLRRADLLGADLRDTDLRAADLTEALYLTQPQVSAARGDARTRLPPGLDRPQHWEPQAR
ncbi:pentapeptide repeat-containing protein [Saccharopolyspora rhizosphaerae]|uniref:Pentapeptide repeat-containing protein n=1 Tax=Saccharopolyspora rhizosphaerae TaxID=2492662 RepID=A0A3R8QVR1_9PSEU|nr:pentapeptide repeat-containing protein [Saccharopolyspora rhizosphaerae]RRO20542.1 pentapeptide repeat-containing protein [Saccharopolyspora rhizosphaerae]